MFNPDGRLWIDRLSGGLMDTGERLSAPDWERTVRLVAMLAPNFTPAPRVSRPKYLRRGAFRGAIASGRCGSSLPQFESRRSQCPPCTFEH
jgi:hypothetical protein